MQVWLCNTAPVHVSAPNRWTNRAWGELKMVNMSGKNLKKKHEMHVLNYVCCMHNSKYIQWIPWCMSFFSPCGFLILTFLAFPSKAVSQRVQREYMLMAMHPEALLHQFKDKARLTWKDWDYDHPEVTNQHKNPTRKCHVHHVHSLYGSIHQIHIQPASWNLYQKSEAFFVFFLRVFRVFKLFKMSLLTGFELSWIDVWS